jgi:hypothetical protein
MEHLMTLVLCLSIGISATAQFLIENNNSEANAKAKVTTSPATLSAITDRVIEDVNAWQGRPLESVYPFVWPNGATLTTDRDGVPNSAYQFDGVDDYIELGSDFDLQEKTLVASG